MEAVVAEPGAFACPGEATFFGVVFFVLTMKI
jgi:hypothetical protein